MLNSDKLRSIGPGWIEWSVTDPPDYLRIHAKLNRSSCGELCLVLASERYLLVMLVVVVLGVNGYVIDHPRLV